MPAEMTRESYKIPCDGGDIAAFRVSAPGESKRVVICIHGNTFPSQCEFDLVVEGHSLMEFLAERGLNTICFDHRGYGASWKPKPGQPLGLKQKAADLAAVIAFVRQRFPNQQIALIGLSTGANTIGELLGEGPQPIERIALMGPLYTMNVFLKSWIKRYKRFRILLKLAFKGKNLYRPFTRKSLEERLMTGEEGLISQDTFERFLKQAIATNPDGDGIHLISPVMAFPPKEWTETMTGPLYDASKFTMPTLILRGERDVICTAEQAEQMARDLPNGMGEIITFKGRKHDFCLYDDYLDTFEAMGEFLTR